MNNAAMKFSNPTLKKLPNYQMVTYENYSSVNLETFNKALSLLSEKYFMLNVYCLYCTYKQIVYNGKINNKLFFSKLMI